MQGRRGRPREGENEARRAAVLDAAFAELVERGYTGTTMLAVARRAGASKETLYSWFGDKRGLFAALVRRQSEQANAAVAEALTLDRPPREALTAFAVRLLRLLLGEASVAINRAAVAAPELAGVLLAEGRHTTGPLVAGYLAGLAARGEIAAGDPEEAFRLLYGLVVSDAQIRVLLGEAPPTDLEERARRAVDRFLALLPPAPVRDPSGRGAGTR
ncbi:TetR family transcriptional regulator [Planomonospora parontospora subsp. parontospora]|uniref:TetR family transcriptional regulator n=2 Tax=Planomonospora parontospora TaxID=58119 RepID=A0AA37BHY5_9ACTN|nr:TetR/AcrR family transcriptional regulator [Planomonospora parontospora]GGK73125.1 TetR family transcriptional regulator [Planomonospora parontospora]GII09361.1 TetR family transcriptional regulator [Planomonospora parontospora subsp. parontospora]